MSDTHFDYIIVGAGALGSKLNTTFNAIAGKINGPAA